jgi:hypothetical protein
MSRRAVILTAIVAGAAISVLLWQFAGPELARHIFGPLLRSLQRLRRTMEEWPQIVLWLVIVGVAALVAARTLVRHAAVPRRRRSARRRARTPSELQRLTRSLARHHRSAAHRHVIRELSQIVALLVARDQRLSAAEAMQRLRRGEINLPPATGALLASRAARRPGELRRYLEAVEELERCAEEGGSLCN